MYRINRKILNSDERDFQILVKSGVLEEIFRVISGNSLKIREGSYVCRSEVSEGLGISDIATICVLNYLGKEALKGYKYLGIQLHF